MALSVGFVLTFLGLTGGFDSLGPFSNPSGPTTGDLMLKAGGSLAAGAGQTYGLYADGTCPKLLRGTKTRLAVLEGGGQTVTVYEATSQPVFNEHFGPGYEDSVQQCATFTTSHAARYHETYVGISSLAIVPSSELILFWLYYVLCWGGIAALVIGTGWLVWVERRRARAKDPKEVADITHDMVALAARANAQYLPPSKTGG